ncbi:transport-associated [Opitutus terrae PB90-1]|uniref:Transport-associated n=2 Tax=Opitutus terrae TaxID=107709 RepID=B1ZVL7_OPITP|nr:transport-associated [Opitutus terrae PB90-1]
MLTLFISAASADPAMDQKIEAAAQSSYNFRAVLGNRVKVEVNEGVVTLSGTVLDRDQKALAEDTVRSLPGVVEVLNHLDVSEPDQERSDGWMALKIRSLLLIRSKVSAANTDVSVHDGVVTLAGTAESEAQKELTESYARGVQGVRAVRNQMIVRSADTAPRAGAASATPETIDDDGSVTAQVKAALLARDPGLALQTRVETAGGTVTIRGTARSRAEKDLVSRVAREIRGVRAVANQMVVSAAE